MAVDYKKIGLVNTKDMFARAIKGGWAVPAFNFNNLEQLQAIIQASSNLKLKAGTAQPPLIALANMSLVFTRPIFL